MQLLKLSVALAAVASHHGASAEHLLEPRDEDVAAARSITNPVAKSYIIEYTSVSPRTRLWPTFNRLTHESKGSSAKRRDGGLFARDDLKVVKSFDSSIFSGATVETDVLNLDSLARLPNVARVWPNIPVQLDPITAELHADASSSGDYSTHVTTGVSKLHEMGYFGEGVKVGVVDTGVYYDHDDVTSFSFFC
jgi:subtilisin family serine protease